MVHAYPLAITSSAIARPTSLVLDARKVSCNTIERFNLIDCEMITGTADSIIHPMFYGNSFLQYTNSDIVARLAGLRTTIILQLRAFR